MEVVRCTRALWSPLTWSRLCIEALPGSSKAERECLSSHKRQDTPGQCHDRCPERNWAATSRASVGMSMFLPKVPSEAVHVSRVNHCFGAAETHYNCSLNQSTCSGRLLAARGPWSSATTVKLQCVPLPRPEKTQACRSWRTHRRCSSVPDAWIVASNALRMHKFRHTPSWPDMQAQLIRRSFTVKCTMANTFDVKQSTCLLHLAKARILSNGCSQGPVRPVITWEGSSQTVAL